MLKTLVIFDWCGESPIQFGVVHDEYLPYLDEQYINCTNCSETSEEILSNLLDQEGFLSNDFPYKEVAEVVNAGESFIVVRCGFLP